MRSTLTLSTLLPALALSLSAAGTSYAIDQTVWNGSDGQWSQADQWSDGLPEKSINVLVPEGTVTLNSYTTARLLRMASEDGKKATLVVHAGGTLEVGSAGPSQLGTGENSVGTIEQKGGQVTIGNDFYIGGFKANGDGTGTYTLHDGTLRVYRGGVILSGNWTGSSTATFNQLGGKVETGTMHIGAARYKGFKGDTVNNAVYMIEKGSLLVNQSLTIGAEGDKGRGVVNADLRIAGPEADVRVRENLTLVESKVSHPSLTYVLNSSRPGVFRVDNRADVSLAGTLNFELPGGFAFLESDTISVIEAGADKVHGTFTKVANEALWEQGMANLPKNRVQLEAKLIKPSQAATLAPGDSQSFAGATSGYAKLEKLQAGQSYELTVSCQDGMGQSVKDALKALQDAGAEAKISGSNSDQIVLTFTASKPEMFLVWSSKNPADAIMVTGLSL